MAKQTYTIVEGFLFTDSNLADRARKEAESVKLIRGKMDLNNPAQVLNLYQKMVAQKMFQTPVGYSFLLEIQEYLKAKPTINLSEISAIPVSSPAPDPSIIKDAFDARSKAVEAAAKAELDRRDEDKGVVNSDAEETAKEKTSDNSKRREKGKKNVSKTLGLSIFLNIILALIVIGMFAVSYTAGSTTILNYEERIVNKYAEWEQNLTEREAALKEREAQTK